MGENTNIKFCVEKCQKEEHRISFKICQRHWINELIHKTIV